jgi:TonB family protein
MYPGESLAGAADPSLGIGPLRPLALALLASFVLHVLVLYALPMLKESIRVPARPLTAHLAKPTVAPARMEPQQQRPLQPPLPPRQAPAAKAARQAAAPEPVAKAPVLSVEPAQQAAEPVPALPAAPPASAPQAPSARADVAPASAPALAAASGPDPGSIARYRLELMEIARRYKRYPRIAQDNNWEGRVDLRIAFAENGSISSLTVKKGAGRAVLDDAAQGMIRSAQAQATIPPALRGKAFTLEIAVDFFLKEEK